MCIRDSVYTHTQTHTHTHTNTRTQTHTHTRTHARARAHTHTHARTNTRAHARTHTPTPLHSIRYEYVVKTLSSGQQTNKINVEKAANPQKCGIIDLVWHV